MQFTTQFFIGWKNLFKMYLHRTTIYKDTANVIGAPADNASNKTDFENNFKASAIAVTEVTLQETTYEQDSSWAQFKTAITSPYTWADVKYIDKDNYYSIFMLTEIDL